MEWKTIFMISSVGRVYGFCPSVSEENFLLIRIQLMKPDDEGTYFHAPILFTESVSRKCIFSRFQYYFVEVVNSM